MRVVFVCRIVGRHLLGGLFYVHNGLLVSHGCLPVCVYACVCVHEDACVRAGVCVGGRPVF